MKRPTKAQMVAQALQWLRAGALASNIPARLMTEFSLSPGAARTIAEAAVKKWKSSSHDANLNDKPGK